MQRLGQRLTYFAPWGLALSVVLAGHRYAPGQETVTPKDNLAGAAAGSVPTPAGTGTTSSAAAINGHEGSPTVVEEPPIYYVRDKEGRLVPLLGFSYEEIQAFMQQKKSGRPASTAAKEYSLEQLVISGEVRGDHAEIVADYKIHLDSADWVSVTLLNAGGVLEGEVSYKGDAEHQLQADAQTGAYAVRLRGKARSEAEVTAKFVVPIKTLAVQHRFEIELPAAAASKLVLIVPQSPIELTNHTGCTLAEIKPHADDAAKSSSGNSSEITMWGLGGPLSLGWQERTAASATAVLEATGQVFAQIDSRSVQFEAQLTVRGFGTQFDKFHVLLPPGAKLSGGAPTGTNYILTAIDSANAGSPTNSAMVTNAGEHSEAQLVEVQLAQPTSEPVEIHLQAERAYDVTKPNQSLELAGFEVQEAAPHRQWGHIAVAVTGDWQLGWGERNRVRQIAELPQGLQRKGLVAGFEYFGQPASLTARVMPRRTRISVEPEYVYFVEGRQLRLEARLKYTIRGAKTSTLDIALPGWEVDECGPDDVVDVNSAPVMRGSAVAIPLLEATAGEMEITLKAHRDLPANATHIDFSLPVPTADVIGLAIVALVPADNIRLHTRDDELQGLTRVTVMPRITLPPREQAPLLYRGEQAQASFAGDLERLPQNISAGVQSAVNVGRDEVTVEQRFAYRVEHEPASSLSFDVPPALLTNSHLDWSLEGQMLTPSSPGPASDNAKTTRLEVPLPEARSGNFEVVAKYQAPLLQLTADHSQSLHRPVAVPLIMPALPELEHNRAIISGEWATRVQSLDDVWTVAEEPLEAGSGAQRPALQLIASEPTAEVTLAWRPGIRQGGATVVERAWIQSWLSGQVRQDRAVYQFTTSADEFALSLPSGISPTNLELQLDHHLLPAVATADHTLKVKLSVESENQRHVLELRYQWENAAARSQMVEVNLPRLPDDVWVQRLYWQLVLPSDEHLLSAPAELTPEFAWKWSGLGWSRQCVWEQTDLEKWVDAKPAEDLPPATNRYLFSTLGSPPKLIARWAARWEMVFVASAAVLAAGLLLIYVPVSRRPWILFAGGIVVAVLAVAMPDAGLLFAQAAALGGMLILLAGWLRRSMAHRRSAGKVVPSSGSSVLERSSIQRKIRPLEFAGTASTTAHNTLEMPAADSPPI